MTSLSPLLSILCVALKHGKEPELAETTDMSIRQIQQALKRRVSRSVVGEIVKRARKQTREAVL